MNEELNKEDIIDAVGCECTDCDCNEVSDKEVIEGLKLPFEPIDERILVKPLEPIKITKTHDVIDEKATAKAKAKNEAGISDIKTKSVTEEVESNLRVGVILAIGEGEYKRTEQHTTPYEVGDKIVYIHKAAMPFELFKDSVLLRKYDILGKWLKA